VVDTGRISGVAGDAPIGGPLAAALNRQLLRDSALSTADYEVLVVLSETPSGCFAPENSDARPDGKRAGCPTT